MKPEEIKVGETYNVRVKVTVKKESGNIRCESVDQNGHTLYGNTFYACEAPAFSPINPANGTKNAEPAPKYDPCRLFKKGDKVRVVKYKGRVYNADFVNFIGAEFFVDENEEYLCDVQFKDNARRVWFIDPAYLELVTPVEELEPYYVYTSHLTTTYEIRKESEPGEFVSIFHKSNHPHAKEAAEAERDRLNAEFAQRMNETTKTQTTDNE